MGVINFFHRGLKLHPDRLCFQDDTVSRTYGQAHDAINQIAAGLLSAGIRSGDRIALLSPNCTHAFEAMLAIYRIQGVFVPLNFKSHVDDSLYLLQKTQTRVLFIHSTMAHMLDTILEQCPFIDHVICLDQTIDKARHLDHIKSENTDPLPAPYEDNTTPVSIYSTGGTTGKPKGVIFTSLTWDTVAANFLTSLPSTTPPVYLVITPMSHASGTIGIPLLSQGASIIIQDEFEPRRVLEAIEKHKVTHLWLPPTAIYMLLSCPQLNDYDYSSLQYFMYSAAPMSVEKLRQCLDVFGHVMVQIYGLTEAPVFCTCLTPEQHDPDNHPQRLASCGQPMLLTPVDIMSDDNELLPAGEIGEIVIRGNILMSEYFEDPVETHKAIQNGWFRTGDIGYRDDDNFIYLIDRKKRMIISGGYNVYPSEIEKVLLGLPGVQECVVIGVPDEKWGESIKAVIETTQGHTLTEEDLIAACKQQLGSIKSPKTIDFIDVLPRTPVGKVDSTAIRQRYWKEHERAI